jgi:hypothetical protein
MAQKRGFCTPFSPCVPLNRSIFHIFIEINLPSFLKLAAGVISVQKIKKTRQDWNIDRILDPSETIYCMFGSFHLQNHF